MSSNAKNGIVTLEDTTMNYVCFGKGSQALIIIPGLGDGLITVKGMAGPLSKKYKKFAEKYKVYVFSRKNHIREGYSTRDMARDQAEAMKILGITKAHVMGVSQGGMIAQYLAIDYPHLVDKLILVVTMSKQNETVQKVISFWKEMARHEDYKGLMLDTAQKSYTESYYKKLRLVYLSMSTIGVGKPKDFSRFLIQADACMHHNAYPELNKIKSRTFVVGGDCDMVLEGNSSVAIANQIKDSILFMYNGLGHGLYEEANDFNGRVLEFLY